MDLSVADGPVARTSAAPALNLLTDSYRIKRHASEWDHAARALFGGRADIAAGWRISGLLPARLEPEAQRLLPDLSGGEGLWSSAPGGDRPVSGDPPRRPRTDGNPFDRVAYLRFLAQPRNRS